MTREMAQKLRRIILQAAELLPDDVAMEAPEFFEKWDDDTDYEVGDRRSYKGLLYKCIQAHHSQPDWSPNVAVSLWTHTSVEEWPEWVQPLGAQDAYMAGDKVIHNGVKYTCDIDNNVWEPGVYGWTTVEG